MLLKGKGKKGKGKGITLFGRTIVWLHKANTMANIAIQSTLVFDGYPLHLPESQSH